MKLKLGTRLLREGLITADQLEEALRAQLIAGGRLGSNLIELGYLDADALARILSQHHNLPLVGHAELVTVMNRMPRVLSAQQIVQLGALPLLVEGRSLHVAVIDPADLAATDAVRFASGQNLILYVVPEIVFWQHLEQNLGLRRPGRSLYAPTPGERELGAEEQAGFYAGRRPTEAPSDLRDADELGEFVLERSSEPADGSRTIEPLGAILEELERAHSRDAVGAALRHFARGRASRAVVFLVRNEALQGWVGEGPDLAPPRIPLLTLSLLERSPLQDTVLARRPYLGPPPRNAVLEQLHAWLGARTPAEIALIPIVLSGRVVNLIYLDNEAAPFARGLPAELTRLARGTIAAYERLLQTIRQRMEL